MVSKSEAMVKIYQEQFGTSGEPEIVDKCRFCGLPYGKHWGTVCPFHSPRGDFGNPRRKSNTEAIDGK